MIDPNQQQRDSGESTLETAAEMAEVGVDIASEGVVDMALEGASAIAEIAGDIIGGVVDIG